MTTCRDVPADLQRNWQNLGEMYVALGVRHSGDTGPGLAPPSTYAESQTLPYMVGPSGAAKRSIDISIFNDTAARACFYQWAGYDENAVTSRIAAIRAENPDDQAAADAAVQTYLGTLTPLQQQIYRVSGMINIFQQDYRLEGGRNVGGANRPNPDAHEAANPNIITDFEIQQYAAEALPQGDQDPQYEPTGGRILSGIHAFIGLMTYVTSAPPAPLRTLDPRGREPHLITDTINLGAPLGGWQTGDQIFINNVLYTPPSPPAVGSQTAVPIPANVNNLFIDGPNNQIEVKNGANVLVTMPVTIQNPAQVAPPPEPVTTSNYSWYDPRGYSGRTWATIGGTVAVASLATFLGFRWGRKGGEVRADAAEAARAEALRLRSEAEARVADLTKQVGDARAVLDGMPAVDLAPREAELARLESELQAKQAELVALNGRANLPTLKSGVDQATFNTACDQYNAANNALSRAEMEARRLENDTEATPADREAARDAEMRAQADLSQAQQNVLNMLQGKGRKSATALPEGYLDARRLESEIAMLNAQVSTLRGQLAAPQAIARARGFLGSRPSGTPPPPPNP